MDKAYKGYGFIEEKSGTAETVAAVACTTALHRQQNNIMNVMHLPQNTYECAHTKSMQDVNQNGWPRPV